MTIWPEHIRKYTREQIKRYGKSLAKKEHKPNSSIDETRPEFVQAQQEIGAINFALVESGQHDETTGGDRHASQRKPVSVFRAPQLGR